MKTKQPEKKCLCDCLFCKDGHHFVNCYPPHNEELTVNDVLNWQKKHELLTSEGAKVAHVRQLLDRALSLERKKWKEELLNGEFWKYEINGVKEEERKRLRDKIKELKIYHQHYDGDYYITKDVLQLLEEE